jgi:PAS domain-containing protein
LRIGTKRFVFALGFAACLLGLYRAGLLWLAEIEQSRTLVQEARALVAGTPEILDLMPYDGGYEKVTQLFDRLSQINKEFGHLDDGFLLQVESGHMREHLVYFTRQLEFLRAPLVEEEERSEIIGHVLHGREIVLNSLKMQQDNLEAIHKHYAFWIEAIYIFMGAFILISSISFYQSVYRPILQLLSLEMGEREKSERKLQQTYQEQGKGILEYRFSDRSLWCSATLWEVIGQQAPEKVSFREMIELIALKDRETFLEALKSVESGKENVSIVIAVNDHLSRVNWHRFSFRGILEAGKIVKTQAVVESVNEIKSSEDSFQSLFEYCPYGAIILENGQIHQINQRALDELDLKRGEVAGAPLARFLPMYQDDGSYSFEKLRNHLNFSEGRNTESGRWKMVLKGEEISFVFHFTKLSQIKSERVLIFVSREESNHLHHVWGEYAKLRRSFAEFSYAVRAASLAPNQVKGLERVVEHHFEMAEALFSDCKTLSSLPLENEIRSAMFASSKEMRALVNDFTFSAPRLCQELDIELKKKSKKKSLELASSLYGMTVLFPQSGLYELMIGIENYVRFDQFSLAQELLIEFDQRMTLFLPQLVSA